MVLDRSTRLRVRRLLKRHQRQVGSASSLAETHFDRNFSARISRLAAVRRFVSGWVLLVVTCVIFTIVQTVGLNQYFLKQGPVDGGTYNEGMVGTFSNANPIYATGLVDTSLSRLVFAGLFRYDDHNQLTGDLAERYEIDSTGKIYRVYLKPNLRWHDGKPLTSKDVAFTYQTIQSADTKSPLFHGWQGITVSAPDSRTVVFTLPNALTAFPYNLTTGILPQHILAEVPPTKMRANSFNTLKPVGSGPFMWDTIQLSRSNSASGSAIISLRAFDNYNSGRPKMDGFILHAYDDEAQLIAAYNNRSIEAMAGLSQVPLDIRGSDTSKVYSFSTTAETMLFFKTSEGILTETALRQALVLATNKAKIVQKLGDGVKPAREPILKGQPAYDRTYEQAGYNPESAKQALDAAGWVLGPSTETNRDSAVRSKDNKPLIVRVSAEDTPENNIVLSEIEQNWQDVGAKLIPILQPKADFQTAVETHSYSALLYGISIGPDADVFAYWHSSQADPRSPNRLNFSEYKSQPADNALAAARTRQDPAVRNSKLKSFLKTWKDDAPAIALYQPSSIYITRGPVAGLEAHTINTDADRYYSVQDWAIRTGYVSK